MVVQIFPRDHSIDQGVVDGKGDRMEQKEVLLIEDDKVDAMTVRRAFEELNIAHRLQVVQDGQAAIDYLLEGSGSHPDLILLDLNMPRMSGIEFLQEKNRYPELRRIPVIVLTTSGEEQDRVNSFNLCVAGYMVKPVEYRRFVEVIKTIDSYWNLSETAS